MKQSTFFLFVFVFQNCGYDFSTKTPPNSNKNPSTLSDKEIALCDSINFDIELAELIKNQTGNSLQLIPQIDSVTGEVLNSFGNGLCALSQNRNSDYDFALNSKAKFLEKGYLIFVFTNDWDFKEYLTILKGSDELDILAWRRTDGINHGHDNTDVIKRFKMWKEQNDFWVVALGRDFVLIEFKEIIKDPERFSQEMYAYCPDAIDQGARDMPTLVRSIIEMNGAYFWWD